MFHSFNLKQKDETVSELNSLNDGSLSLVNINERLSDIRGLKIYDYTKLKEVIKQKHLDLVQNLLNEEKTLLEKLDSQIELEKKYNQKMIQLNYFEF